MQDEWNHVKDDLQRVFNDLANWTQKVDVTVEVSVGVAKLTLEVDFGKAGGA